MSSPIVPCLWFDDQAEEAASFYTKTFPKGRVTAVSHYSESRDNPGGKPRGSVLTVEFEIAGQRFTALNGGPIFVINPSISFFAHVDEVGEAERLFGLLSDGGDVLMPFGSYPWSEGFGWAKDRFGVSWQVIAGRRAPGSASIVPCLMFTDAQKGKANEAMEAYVRIFPGGKIQSVERYAAGEGPTGTVKHARFVVAGQDLIAMDSPIEHGFGFNGAVSLQVMCKDQGEVDRYWEALSEGGERGPCGWLKDRFGLSWQIVPIAMVEWMASRDAAARDRAFEAMLGMKKLDVAALQAAFEGR
ncbi:VOC family protein [Vulgatibacter incomptus]|uniref:3-demethylubiquinone-9 3-methyltransferase n=1 Tax=Vulgatibacter incomptus TaxID=1391653 RepID=A0A0K1PGK4_9BACT|nr:VOC family protein [Vulgatibacter incomptus]AKU92551.1 3-demethylubiquinone-9 3-methyltransferase [Vulgatibacter incomptus]